MGSYFADKKNGVNANGYERRLGGRMGLYARVSMDGETLVIGSTHKLSSHVEDVSRFIGTSKAISGGDQYNAFCKKTGLESKGNQAHKTWPASCNWFGRARGDNVCSNLELAGPEMVSKPCLDAYGIKAQLSDHAIIMTAFRI